MSPTKHMVVDFDEKVQYVLCPTTNREAPVEHHDDSERIGQVTCTLCDEDISSEIYD